MENNNVVASNKLAVIHVLAALIQNPLLFTDNNYVFSIDDFPDQFHKILYGAVEHLAKNGMEKIGYIDIDQFLKQYTVQYQVFCSNRGVEYIQKALEIYDAKKFDYYYQTLKKYSLLNKLNAQGIDTTDLYDPNILDPVASAKMYEKFDNLTVNDILEYEETKVLLVKEVFGSSSDRVENKMGDSLAELVAKLNTTPVMGLPLMSPKLTTIYRGIRRGCVYMVSSGAGFGKSRSLVGEAVHLAVPEYYDPILKKWKVTNLSQKVLLIETELELSEVQTMVLAAVSGVGENKILDGRYEPEEKKRIDKAVKLIEKADLYVVAITNYDTEDLITTIKKYHQIYGVDYVVYDYLSENLKILAEGARKSRVSGLRTDQILLSMITAIKDCAKQLNLFVLTATQLSGDFKNAKELDASYLRAAKALADKVDCAAILMPVREQDQPAIDSYCAKGFELVPNFVLSIFKVRRGSYQNIKVYVYFDRSTCRMYDTFVTDNKGAFLPIEDTNVEIVLDQTSETDFHAAYTGESKDPTSDNDWEVDF